MDMDKMNEYFKPTSKGLWNKKEDLFLDSDDYNDIITNNRYCAICGRKLTSRRKHCYKCRSTYSKNIKSSQDEYDDIEEYNSDPAEDYETEE